jgi:hypothetical protein
MTPAKGNSNRFAQRFASNYDAANRNVLLFIDKLSGDRPRAVNFANNTLFVYTYGVPD